MSNERARLAEFFRSINTNDVIALPPDPERHNQSDGHHEARQEASAREIADPQWLFWHRQAAASFDNLGQLTAPLRINWGGDHARIAALLATLPEPFQAIDNGPGGVFEITSAAMAPRAAAPFPDVTDTAATKARIQRITAHEPSAGEWRWLNDVLVGGELPAQGYVVRHLAGTDHLTDEAFDALMANWAKIYTEAPTDVLVRGLLMTLRERHDGRLDEVIADCVKRQRWTFQSGVAHFLTEVGAPEGLPLLYELALTPGKYTHTPGNGAALRGWLKLRAGHEGRPVAEVAVEALGDPNFDAAARVELEKIVARGW